MVFIEIGNSSVKAVRIIEGNRQNLFRVDLSEENLLADHLLELRKNEFVLLSSVRKDLTSLLKKRVSHLRFHEITRDRLGVIQIDYDTPETLGIDRVIACAGAVEIASSDVIVVDAGTACTVDYMTKSFCFKGGVIMPGLPILRHSMETLLPELPQVEQSIPEHFPGKSTAGAIRIGLNGGFVNAVNSFIQQYRQLYGGAKVLFTGGDGEFIAKSLGAEYVASFHENLVFDGMGTYLRINEIGPG